MSCAKRIILTLMLIILMSGVSHGAPSDDVYVRKDMLEVYMQSINAKMDMLLEGQREQRNELREQRNELTALKEKVAGLSERIEAVNASLSAKIDSNYASLSGRIDGNYASLSNKIDGNYASLSEKIDSNRASLSERISGNYASLSNRMGGLEARMDDFRNYLYLMIVLLGIVVTVPSVQKFWQWKTERKPSITLEDVKRLIEENNARQAGYRQATGK